MKLNKILENVCYTYLYNFDLVINQEVINSFKDIKYVFMQGSAVRAKVFAKKLAWKILNINSKYFEPSNLLPCHNFSAYRVGNVLSVSHGMGNTSILTLLHSLTKLLHYAGNNDLKYIRLGTSGGVNLDPGTVVLTEMSYMPNLQPGYKLSALGQEKVYPAQMDSMLNQSIIKSQPDDLGFKIVLGNTIAADDFYLGQARLDGAIKSIYDEAMRDQYFSKVQQLNIVNFEMESTALASFCARAEIPATMVAVTLVNRLLSDQITVSPEVLNAYSDRPQDVALNYLSNILAIES